jgi:hypothetical protein
MSEFEFGVINSSYYSGIPIKKFVLTSWQLLPCIAVEFASAVVDCSFVKGK